MTRQAQPAVSCNSTASLVQGCNPAFVGAPGTRTGPSWSPYGHPILPAPIWDSYRCLGQRCQPLQNIGEPPAGTPWSYVERLGKAALLDHPAQGVFSYAQHFQYFVQSHQRVRSFHHVQNLRPFRLKVVQAKGPGLTLNVGQGRDVAFYLFEHQDLRLNQRVRRGATHTGPARAWRNKALNSSGGEHPGGAIGQESCHQQTFSCQGPLLCPKWDPAGGATGGPPAGGVDEKALSRTAAEEPAGPVPAHHSAMTGQPATPGSSPEG